MWKEQLAAPAKTALCIPDMRMPIGPGLSCHHIKFITAPTCRERRCSLRVFRVKRGLCSTRLEGASLIHTCMCADVWPHACLVFSIQCLVSTAPLPRTRHVNPCVYHHHWPFCACSPRHAGGSGKRQRTRPGLTALLARPRYVHASPGPVIHRDGSPSCSLKWQP